MPALLGPSGVYGGAERFALELARAMARRTLTRLVCFGTPAGSRQERELGIYTCRNWLPGKRFEPSPAGPGLLPHLAWAEVVHCHQTHTMSSSVALLYCRAFRKPIFATDHNGGGFCLQNLMDTEGWYTGHLWVSEFVRRTRRLRLDDRVIWGGVDAERFRPDPAGTRTGEVLYVGRLIPGKGVDYLVEAVDADTPLTLLGPVYDPAYLALLQRLAAGKAVRFLPAGGDAEIVPAYQRALCAVLPSVPISRDGQVRTALPESLGLTLLEAMACARPVICTRVGGMPEIVRDGETGFVVPPNDAAALGAKIRWLRDHPAEARRMGEAARARVEAEFTWEAVAERCLNAYAAARD